MSNTDTSAKGGSSHKRDLFYFAPEKLTVVTDRGHPLYDERVNLPLKDSMVESIIEHGVLEQVLVRRNGAALEVVDGRQRVRHAVEANRRLVMVGQQPTVRVPILIRKDDDATSAKIIIAANEQRVQDSPLVKAKKAQRLLDHGASPEEAAAQFGMSLSAFSAMLKILDADSSVQKLVDKGEVTISAACKLAGLSREQQKQAVAEMKESGKGLTVKNASKAAKAKREGKQVSTALAAIGPPSRKLLEALADAYGDGERKRIYAEDLLTWVITGQMSENIEGPGKYLTLLDWLASHEKPAEPGGISPPEQQQLKSARSGEDDV